MKPLRRPRREPLLAPDGSGLQDTYYTGVLLGPSGVGKTTLAEQIAFYYLRLGGRAWAIDPNGAWEDSPEINGRRVKSLWPKDGDEGVDALLIESEKWPAGLMIGDDADRYARYVTQIMRVYMTSNRHMKKDQMWLARRPQGIPKDLFGTMRFICLFAGSLMEPGAHKYLSDTFPDEILDRVPTKPFHYLQLVRDGGRWTHEVRKTTKRSIQTKSDKT